MLSETEWSGTNMGLLKSRSKFVSILKMGRREKICASGAVNFTRMYGIKCQKILNLIILL